ncbi:MAG: sunset domain-containing protein [Latilactobacillus curvatus]
MSESAAAQAASESARQASEAAVAQANANAAAQAASAQAATPATTGADTTTNQGVIIGNTRSHIYHVPGQATYHMSSSNTITFPNEQAAIAAGYRKSER